MKTYSEFAVTGNSFDAIIRIFRKMLSKNPGWTTSEKHNRSYSRMHGERCFYFQPPLELIGVLVAVAFAGTRLASGRTKMHITNIVPKHSAEINMAQYNKVVDEVRRLVMKASKESSIKTREYFKSGEWAFEDVIPREDDAENVQVLARWVSKNVSSKRC